MVNFRVTVNKCITELIHGFIIRAAQVRACTVHVHAYMRQAFAGIIFMDSLHHEKQPSAKNTHSTVVEVCRCTCVYTLNILVQVHMMFYDKHLAHVYIYKCCIIHHNNVCSSLSVR